MQNFSFHLQNALKAVLPHGCFPKPVNRDLDRYLKWDDWRVLGLLADDKGGEHGKRLACRNHFREITHTPETPSAEDLDKLVKWRIELGDLLAVEIPAEKSWYKMGPSDIQILAETPGGEVKPLSSYSSVVKNLQTVRQIRLYALPENRDQASSIIVDI